MSGDTSHSDNPQEAISDQDERDLAALADGSLSGRRRAAVEARVAESPALRAALERQRAGLTALRGLDLAAPAGLRRRLDAERRSPSRTVRRRRLQIFGGLAGAAAAAALVAALVLPGGAAGPTVVEAAELAERPATQATVPADPGNPKLLEASVEGVPFPNLAEEFDWREAGARSDQLEGREARTVFYQRAGRRIGYTIISGEAIDPPGAASSTTLNEVELSSISDGGREIVTWLRDGRTCVLSGEDVSERELLELASWKGDGAVPF
jgi:hypothetical protein